MSGGKHLGIVDEQLARFTRFAGRRRISLDDKSGAFDLQLYADAVFEFVGSLMETSEGVFGDEAWRP